MGIITRRYHVITWGNDIKDKQLFHFYINDVGIAISKSVSIMISKLAHDKYIHNSTVESASINLYLSCNDTIDIISEFLKTGILRYENDQLHNRDIFEVGKAFGIEFLLNLFCEFVKSSFKEINEETFFDIYDCSTIKNDTNLINECISFFASKMDSLQEIYKIKAATRYGYDFLEQVLTSKYLKFSNEDSLVNTIIALSKYDISFFHLLNHVRVEFCNEDSIISIKKIAMKHSLESISTEVFERALLNSIPIPRKPLTHNNLELSELIYFNAEAKLSVSKIEEYPQFTILSNNMRQLLELEKSDDNLYQIYGVINNASLENDISTIKFAINEKYIDVCNEHFKNLIILASWDNNLPVVKHLYNLGANVQSKAYSYRTILHYFCQKGNLEGVKFALNFIDINAKALDDSTPLHDVIKFADKNKISICDYLISQPNIDKNVKNKNGETPLQIAINLKEDKIAELLRINGFTV